MDSTLVAHEQFWAKVRKLPDPPGATGCWLWTGKTDKKGSPRCGAEPELGREVLARRAAWVITRGPVPVGKIVLPSCGAQACIRPEHLFLRARKEWVSDRNRAGRLGRASKMLDLGEDHRALRRRITAAAAERRLRRADGSTRNSSGSRHE